MQVVGTTSEREVLVASADRRFRLNELLIVEDITQGVPVGEVIETLALNPLAPAVSERSPFVLGNDTLASLADLGFNLEKETVYLARLRMLDELFYPLPAGAVVREPVFNEVSHLLVSTEPAQGLIWGSIRGTESLLPTLPPEYLGLAPILENGQLLGQPGVPLVFNYRAMQDYPHIGVFGGSGSGKSFGLRVLIEEMMDHHIPLLVLDPHFEMSFDESYLKNGKSYSSQTQIYMVGQDVGVQFSELTENDLSSLLDAISPMSEAMDAAVKTVIRLHDTLESFSLRLELLNELLEAGDNEFTEAFNSRRDFPDQRKAEELQRLKKLASQIGGIATLRAIRWRLNRLANEGIFMPQGANRIEEGLKSGKTVVVRGSSYLLRVYAAYLLRRLYYLRRSYRDALQRGINPPAPFPPFILVTDEAHNFAPRGENNIPSRREIREIAQEGRKYGIFLILATQRPFLLDDTVNAQLNTKLIFRTVRSTDLQSIREETDLNAEEIKRLPYLQSGNCFLSSPVFGRTVSLRIRAAHTTSPHAENPFDELANMQNREYLQLKSVMSQFSPFQETDFVRISRLMENSGYTYTVEQLQQLTEQWCQMGWLRRESGLVDRYYLVEPGN
ncbi:MAG: ATP-binding protein [Methylocystaceae bacterium]